MLDVINCLVMTPDVQSQYVIMQEEPLASAYLHPTPVLVGSEKFWLGVFSIESNSYHCSGMAFAIKKDISPLFLQVSSSYTFIVHGK